MNKNVRLWLHGLGAAFIGGTATSLSTILVDGEKFNLETLSGLKHLAVVAIVAGVVSAVGYLKQSPLPQAEDSSSAAPKAAALIAIAALVLMGGSAHAQDVSNLYMAGVSVNSGAAPAVAGSALYAHQVNQSGTYAFALYDAVPASYKPFTVTTNVGIGIAQRVTTINGISIFAPTSAGVSYSGSNTGWAWSTGAGAVFKVKDTKDGGAWYVMPTVRVLKSSVSAGAGYQPILGVLVGWGK